MTAQPNIVLVHGAWADGSCWSAVIERLQSSGYDVTAPQFPESSLAADVARLRQVLDRQDGPVIVAGHSYGGQIMTALGTDARNVSGLVYIAAFGLDEGESIGALLATGPPTPALAHLDIDSHGFAWLPEDDFVKHFAADIDPVQARVMHAVQQPLAASTLQDVIKLPGQPGRRPRAAACRRACQHQLRPAGHRPDSLSLRKPDRLVLAQADGFSGRDPSHDVPPSHPD